MMALGDFAVYLAVLSAIGWVPLAIHADGVEDMVAHVTSTNSIPPVK